MARSQGGHAARSGPCSPRAAGAAAPSGGLEKTQPAPGPVSPAGVALLRYTGASQTVGQIEPERRVPRAYQTLGNFSPSLPLAAAFPANPFARHPRKVPGHHNPLGFNFPTDETKLNQFSRFALNYYGTHNLGIVCM